ncbi:MAG: hypothetical protein OSA77_01585 [Halioglobus sp.]|jgi:hypothetical protein|nr:hypothetical protein [Halioglobus sp.]
MKERYNVYFAGRLMDGHDLDSVREKLAKVFNVGQQTLDKSFSGKNQLIKSDCDKATALKYKVVMQRAGADPTINRIESEPIQANPAPAKIRTAAEKIAALAAAPITGRLETLGLITPASVTQQENTIGTGGIGLAAPGTDVLHTNERAALISRNVNTSGLALGTLGQRLSQEPSAPPAMPDTSHLNMAPVGHTIPNLPLSKDPVSPNIDDLTLSPLGFDFSDCVALKEKSLLHDLSALSLTPSNV